MRSTGIPRTSRLANVQWGGILGDQTGNVYMPLLLYTKLGLVPGGLISLKLGCFHRDVRLGVVKCVHGDCEPIIFVSSDIIADCQVPAGTSLTLRASKGELCAGPLIGLFTVKNLVSESLFASQEPTLEALTKTASELYGLIFVFTPEDLDFDRLTVTGRIPVTIHETGQPVWVPLTLPIPDIIYDRIPTRLAEIRPEVLAAKQRLMSVPGLHYFNPMFLDKWETYLILKDIPAVEQYLPPTQLVESFDDIAQFVDRYGAVFLKPSSGSLGRRIIKIELTDQGQFRYMYRSKDRQTMGEEVPDVPALSRILSRLMGRRLYIVQPDLQLARYQECPIDVRVLAQKDMWGRWRRTKIYVRKAAPDSFLSNLSDGAKPESISTVLAEVFNSEFTARAGLGEKLRQAVTDIPPALEEATGMLWGELGIDLGIDCEGKIWLIEINSKPFRALTSESGSWRIIERSLMRPLEFAKYLSGFYRHSPVREPMIGESDS